MANHNLHSRSTTLTRSQKTIHHRLGAIDVVAQELGDFAGDDVALGLWSTGVFGPNLFKATLAKLRIVDAICVTNPCAKDVPGFVAPIRRDIGPTATACAHPPGTNVTPIFVRDDLGAKPSFQLGFERYDPIVVAGRMVIGLAQ